MNVFNIQAFGNYAGGAATVAAESVEQALELINGYDSFYFGIRWMTPDKVLTLPVVYEGEAKVLDLFLFAE